MFLFPFLSTIRFLHSSTVEVNIRPDQSISIDNLDLIETNAGCTNFRREASEASTLNATTIKSPTIDTPEENIGVSSRKLSMRLNESNDREITPYKPAVIEGGC